MLKTFRKGMILFIALISMINLLTVTINAKTAIYSEWSSWSTTPVTASETLEVETKTVNEYWRTRYDYDYYCTWHNGSTPAQAYEYSNTGGNVNFSSSTGSYATVYSYTKNVQAYPNGFYRTVAPGYILSKANGELPGCTAWMDYCKNAGNQVGYALRADQTGQIDGRNQIFFLVNIQDEYHDVTYYRYRTVTAVYSVTYNANGGMNAPDAQDKFSEQDLVLSSQIPVRDGYTFLGWAPKTAFASGKKKSILNLYINDYSADLSTVFATPAYQPGDVYSEDADITLYAAWQGDSFIYYDANGGKYAPATQTFNEGETVSLSTAIPIRDGFAFEGWAESADAQESTYQPGGSYTGETTTLYAVWTETEPGTFVVTFNANGGEGGPNYQLKTAMQDLVLTTEKPTRYGYNFNVWSDNSFEDPFGIFVMGEKYAPGDIYSKEKSVILYAHWKHVGTAAYHVETYSMNTLGEYDLISDRELEFTKNENVSAEYLVNEGFTLNEELSVLNGVVASDGSLVLKVYLDRNKYNVSFNDGNEIISNQLYFGSEIIKPRSPEKDDYIFEGWSEDGETVVEVAETVPDRDLFYYAVWSVKQQFSASISADRVVRGDKLVWTVKTPKSVTELRFNGEDEIGNNYTSYYKFRNYIDGSSDIVVTDTETERLWSIPMLFNYPGTQLTDNMLWNIEYKRDDMAEWQEMINSETGVIYEFNIRVGKNAAALMISDGEYDKFTLIDATYHDSGENDNYKYFIVITTDDVSDVRISYVNEATGKIKRVTMHQDSQNVIAYDTNNGISIWTIRYKVAVPVLNDEYIVQCRGNSWGDEMVAHSEE